MYNSGPSDATVVFWIILWFIGAGMNSFIASEKGRGGLAAFFSSIIFSPMLTYLYLLAVPALSIKKSKKKEGP